MAVLLGTVLLDSDRRCAQVERREVGKNGRSRSENEKLEIVLAKLHALRQGRIAASAWRFRVSRSLLSRWRRSLRPEPNEAVQFAEPRTGDGGHGVGSNPVQPVRPEAGRSISRAAGARMRSTGTVDAPMLKAAVGAVRWSEVMTRIAYGRDGNWSRRHAARHELPCGCRKLSSATESAARLAAEAQAADTFALEKLKLAIGRCGTSGSDSPRNAARCWISSSCDSPISRRLGQLRAGHSGRGQEFFGDRGLSLPNVGVNAPAES